MLSEYKSRQDQIFAGFTATLQNGRWPNTDWKEVFVTYKSAQYAKINKYSRQAIENFLKGTAPLGVQYSYPMIAKYGATFARAFHSFTPFEILSEDTGGEYFLREPVEWQREAIHLIFLNDISLHGAATLLTKPVRVYRGLALDKEDFKVGEIINQVSLWSTSLFIAKAMDFFLEPCCVFVIDLPEHYPSVWMEGYGATEAELLLTPFRSDGRVRQFKIVDRKEESVTYRQGSVPCYELPDVEDCLRVKTEVTRKAQMIYCVPI